MKLSVGYYKGSMEFDIPDNNLLGVLKPNYVDTELIGAEEVIRALKEPIGSRPLREIVKPGEKIVIITSDITRPMPSKIVLPPVLEELVSGGVNLDDVTVVFALGSHRGHTEEEKKYLAGEEIYNRVKCIDCNPKDFVHLGTTRLGTPVDIFRTVAEADRRICLGNIEYHYFAGYSGGAKAIMPGVSTRAAIQSNHSRMINDYAYAGNIDTNLLRLDIEEAIKYVGIDFIVNVVLNEKKEIIKAVVGDYINAHRAGCRFLDSLYMVDIAEKADIVITTPGGYPKDINLYQSQKALDNSKGAVKKDGIIILAASCREGLGERVFEKWITEAEKPEELVLRIKEDFQLGGHKAAAIAMVLENARIFLVSDMEPDFVRSIFMEPFSDMESALNEAMRIKGNEAKVLVMPYGGSTLPKVKEADK